MSAPVRSLPGIRTSPPARRIDNVDRVLARPDPEEWSDDELLTLPEAARLFWPKGPLTAATLRTAGRDGKLRICVIASKHYTSRRAILEMTRDMERLGTQPRADPGPENCPTPLTTAVERLETLRRAKGR